MKYKNALTRSYFFSDMTKDRGKKIEGKKKKKGKRKHQHARVFMSSSYKCTNEGSSTLRQERTEMLRCRLEESATVPKPGQLELLVRSGKSSDWKWNEERKTRSSYLN